MELRFLLNGIEINEPIGFDGFNPVIERTDHHGMSVSVSLSKIGFYGKALEIIEDAYNTDIDTELPFIVEINRDGDWNKIYSGVIDLASYERVSENGACRINCNVGEIGIKTTFNNRYDTKVELNRKTSLDDDPLTEYPMLKKEITFPSKEIVLTSLAEINEDTETFIYDDFTGFDAYDNHSKWFFIPFGEPSANEIEYFNSESTASLIESLNDRTTPNGIIEGSIPDGSCIFVFNEDYQIKSPNNFNIDINIKFDLDFLSLTNIDIYGFIVYIYHCNTDGTVKKSLGAYSYYLLDGKYASVSIYFNNDGNYISMISGEKIAVLLAIALFSHDEKNSGYKLKYTAKEGSKFYISATSKTECTNHNVSMVHESLSKLSEIIGGLTVKSDWYGRINSGVNPQNGFGGGSLKAILNGYELRNANLTSGERPPIMLSFKDMFESLNAIDNIGWGFLEEKDSLQNEELYLRVERWQWFYKDDEIMRINHPNNVKRTINADKVYTGLRIGFEKYLDDQEIHSIDTFHTNREYYTGLKAVDVKLEKICKFIADPYAIEVTRRQQFIANAEKSNWKYDEDIFIIALYFSEHEDSSFLIDMGIIDDANTIISPDTLFNVRISPQRNAIRWAERFFEVTCNKNSLDYTAGTGNVTAKGKPYPGDYVMNGNYYLEDSGVRQSISERDSISRKEPLLKPEILSFDYPITFEQYAKILANPYGKIIVDGEECYIQKITPNLIERKASFELIPKKV